MTDEKSDRYEPNRYWEQRFSERLDITTVGHAGLGQVYNSWLYKARFRTLRRTLRTLGIVVGGKSIVELGVGSGMWLSLWQKYQPATLTGIDITAASITALEARYPQFQFLQGDLGLPLPLLQKQQFDIVTAFDVLFHIVDDASFSQAIANIGMLARPGGWIIVGDSFCSQPWGPIYHEYHRSYTHYKRELQAVGVMPVSLQPVFFTMTTTLCNESGAALDRLTRLFLWCISKVAAYHSLEVLNHVPGLGLYLIDGLLARVCKTGPSLKLLIARKA